MYEDFAFVSLLLSFVAGYFVLLLVVYAVFAYSLQRIANKTNTEDAWMAWVPILNLILMLRVAKMSLWTIIGLFIPLVNIAVIAFVWGNIAAALNKSKWLGILALIPALNLALILYLAFSDTGVVEPVADVPLQFQ